MKVVLLCWGSLGDTLPFLRLARVMKSRGHDVALAGNGSFARLGDRFDVALAELSSAEDYEALLKQPVRRIYSLGPRLAKTTYAFIEQHHIPGETVLVAPTFLFGARLAQERLQAPLATVHLAPLIARVGVPDLRSRFATLPFDLMWRSPVNRFRRELGLPSIKTLFPWCNSPVLEAALYPDWFAPSGRAVPLGFPLARERILFEQPDEELKSFLAEGHPPLVFTKPPYLAHKVSEQKLIALAERMDRRAVFVGPGFRRMEHLPAGMIHRKSVDHESLLPRTALHVHPGAIGTVATTLATGTPQVILPLQGGHFNIGQHLCRLGVSLNIRPRALRIGKGARKIRELLESDEVLERCQHYAERCREQDGLLNLALALERLHAQTYQNNSVGTD
jgi:UDP:flavonoid glycosyltransferase YjiC (YdhE family)